MKTKLVGLQQETDGWTVHLSRKVPTHPPRKYSLCSDWLIDCSGRACAVARRIGIERLREDGLVAHSLLFHRPLFRGERDEDGLAVIEAAEDGWWYTCRQPQGHRIVVYLSDGDLAASRAARSTEGFLGLLAETRFVRQRVINGCYVPCGTPVGNAAHSGRLGRMVGERWLAAGDAALAFDPIAGQGLFHGLYSGMRAAETVLASSNDLGSAGGALETYAHEMAQVYNVFRRRQRRVYAGEQRWAHSEFWRRRHVP